MKKLLIIAALVISAGAFMASNSKRDTATPPSVAGAQTRDISVTVNDGTSSRTRRVVASTALEALEKASAAQGIPVRVKTYPFGTLVESVAGKANSRDKSWIFFVNGKSGTEASDRTRTNPGDIVEWRYMTPQF